jgi:protein disulfide-isomerase
MKHARNLLIVCGLLAVMHNSQAQWLTDFSAAQGQAQRENKAMLLDFTGSDWCGWCIKLNKEVFSQQEFQTFAARNLVMVEVDFPKRKTQSPAQQKTNRELAQRFGIRGYPTLVLLNAQGQEIARTGYRPGGPKPFVAEIAKMIGVPDSSASATPKAARAQTKKDRPLYGGAPLQPPPKYDALELKGISGTAQRRFALINNQTFMEGETAGVRFEAGQIRVRCVEIKEDSVVIEVGREKERREIFLTKTH